MSWVGENDVELGKVFGLMISFLELEKKGRSYEDLKFIRR